MKRNEEKKVDVQQHLYPVGPYECFLDNNGAGDTWDIYAPNVDQPLASVDYRGESEGWSSREDDMARAGAIAWLFAAAPELHDALMATRSYLRLLLKKEYEKSRVGLAADAALHKVGSQSNGPFAWDSNRMVFDHVVESLSNVLDHYTANAKADFDAATGDVAGNHIYTDLCVLRDWLRPVAKSESCPLPDGVKPLG